MTDAKVTPPRIIGHRGAAAYAPENTLAGIHAAADMAVEWVAIDVKLTADHVPVLFHDDELARTTGAEGRMEHKPYAAVAELDAGSWYGDSFIGERVPTLEDALDAMLERDIRPVLLLRPAPGAEVVTAEAALDAASRVWPEDVPPPILVSASHVTLETCRDMLPEWPRGLLLEEPAENWAEMGDYLDISLVHAADAGLTRDIVEEYIESTLPVIIHGVNDQPRAEELSRWGADAVVTDTPDTMREALERFH
jgi:glycerophosphoryl diester phosphodiesterase